MATEYAWKIETLETAVSDSDQADVVKQIHWRMNADDGGGFSATAYGTVAAGDVDGDDFTAFGDLTVEQVVGWVIPKLDEGVGGEDGLKALLDQQIANEKNPPVVNKIPAAWSA